MKNTSSVDEKPKPEIIGFQCVCGLEFCVNLSDGPAKFTAECPDFECRRLFVVEYVGRVPMPLFAPAEQSGLKLAQ